MPIDALSVLCAQLTLDLLAIAKFLFDSRCSLQTPPFAPNPLHCVTYQYRMCGSIWWLTHLASVILVVCYRQIRLSMRKWRIFSRCDNSWTCMGLLWKMRRYSQRLFHQGYTRNQGGGFGGFVRTSYEPSEPPPPGYGCSLDETLRTHTAPPAEFRCDPAYSTE